MKKAGLAIILISALLFSGAESLKRANANPTMYAIVRYSGYTEVDPIPVKIPPSITIYSPKNNADYSSNNMTVSFLAENAELDGWQSHVISIWYYLDGNPSIMYIADLDPLPVFDATFNLSKLSSGKHKLTVTADVDVLRYDSKQVFFLKCSSTVFFTTSFQPTPTSIPDLIPAPKLTVATPKTTATPEATSQPEIFPASLFFVASVGIALAAIGLFVYLKKRQKDKSK